MATAFVEKLGAETMAKRKDKPRPNYIQVGTLLAILGGGGAGAGAYSDVADQLQEANIQAARTEETLRGLSLRLREHEERPHAGAVELIDHLTTRVSAVELKLAACPCAASPRRR